MCKSTSNKAEKTFFLFVIRGNWFQRNSSSCRLVVSSCSEQIFNKKNPFLKKKKCQQDIDKHVPDFFFLTGEIWQACTLPPTLYLLSFIPVTHIKRAKINVIYFYISVLNALWWLKNSLIFFFCSQKKKKFKASRSAGFSLCKENVQSITLSLIIHVTTSWAARALALTPRNHYGAMELKEWSTLISSEESYGDIFQPLSAPLTAPPPPGCLWWET